MRTTIKLRIKEVADAEDFIEDLKEWLEDRETNVSLQIGDTRWIHFGRQKRVSTTTQESPSTHG